jgi:uncharacterized protein (UPF0548 family)
MLTLRRPSAGQIATFLEHQARSSFSYPAVGATATAAPDGFAIDRNRVCLGRGADTFRLAAAALRRWDMFDLGWVHLHADRAPATTGTNVAVVVHRFGVWWLNACRVVYVVDEPTRFALAYGTLSDHAASGEERFSVEWRQADDSVTYDILAFSRPRHPLARLGRPVARSLQRRFARDSLEAMLRATRTSS